MTEPPFSTSSRFPQRRRVIQACVNCRMRKTRCDAAQPRCSLCVAQNVECVYRDSQQPRIDHNTTVLLERIQLLEDRLLSSTASFGSQHTTNIPQSHQSAPAVHHAASPQSASHIDTGASFDVQIPLSHTANANHVYSWPIVRQLLSESSAPADVRYDDATDAFFETQHLRFSTDLETPAESWRLYSSPETVQSREEHRELVDVYFSEVDTFYPFLSKSDVLSILDKIFQADTDPGCSDKVVPASSYALVLLVLCLASLAASGKCLVRLDPNYRVEHNLAVQQAGEQLWQRAMLLLGYISSATSLEAAQCSLLSSLYLGAQGRVADAFYWSHITAVKCEALARDMVRTKKPAPESFRRLFWLAYIYEGDFISEISITLPSGIARYEDVVPYPTTTTALGDDVSSPASGNTHDELVAFQITTNAVIRCFLNRVNSVVYDSKEQHRTTRDNYAEWLLRISEDLWSHHAAVYRSLPDFLLTSQESNTRHTDINSPLATVSPATRIEELPLGNSPWNILRLKGRYHAGQYIIHRPFIEYVLLNLPNFESHPCKSEILEKVRLCIDGCIGFISVFDTEPANSITCLFAAGMVTFTMVIILMVSTVCPIFRPILPNHVEDAIKVGLSNLRRFSMSVDRLRWHIHVLQRLDMSRKERINRRSE